MNLGDIDEMLPVVEEWYQKGRNTMMEDNNRLHQKIASQSAVIDAYKKELARLQALITDYEILAVNIGRSIK